jgi:hypothetical protein
MKGGGFIQIVLQSGSGVVRALDYKPGIRGRLPETTHNRMGRIYLELEATIVFTPSFANPFTDTSSIKLVTYAGKDVRLPVFAKLLNSLD